MTRPLLALSFVVFASPFVAGCGAQPKCVAGIVVECPCGGGVTGTQACQADGTFGACTCAQPDAGPPQGDAGTLDSGVADAGTTDAGTTDAGTTDAGTTDAGTPDAGGPVYSGLIAGATSVWSALPMAAGQTGLAAGNTACRAQGADHVCDYEELLVAQQRGELSAIPMGTTLWLHRTTTAMVMGQPSAPGPGGRCNDWTYSTNHSADGEYVSFDTAGVPTFHLDADTVFDPVSPGVHTVVGLQCGGETRALACCFAP
jgi:hypothetical protein